MNKAPRNSIDSRLMRAVRFIEQNLDSELRLRDIADRAAISDHHFHRLFRASFGLPVIDYLHRRRLAMAARHLVDTGQPIIEIAFAAGFNSQSAFTRAFRRVYHTSPSAYRRRNRHVPWLSADALTEETLSCLPGLNDGSPKLEVASAFTIAGLDAEFSGDGRPQIPALWRQLAALVDPEVFWAAPHFGVSDGSDQVLGGVFRYMAGILLRDPDAIPPGLTRLEIPASSYLAFRFRGPPERIPAAIDYLFGVWIPNSGHNLHRAPSFEKYPPQFKPDPGNCELELWLPVDAQ